MTQSFLTEGPLTISDVIDSIRAQSLDESDRPIWSDAQIKLAIRQAVLNTKGKFFTTDMTTIEFESGNFGPYELPRAVQRITLITRQQGLSGVINPSKADRDVRSYRHQRNREENVLYFTRDYPTCTMTIWYETDVTVPVDDRLANGNHSSLIETLSLVDSTPNLWQAGLPSYWLWDSEIIKLTGFSSNASATIVRGQFGTTAAGHVDGSVLKQLIVADDSSFYNFLFSDIGRLLNQWRVQAGNRNTNVGPNITATRFFKEDRDEALQSIRQVGRTRKMTFKHNRRLRRG